MSAGLRVAKRLDCDDMAAFPACLHQTPRPALPTQQLAPSQGWAGRAQSIRRNAAAWMLVQALFAL